MASQGEITKILRDMKNGDQEAAASLLSLLYSELRSIAGHFMRSQRPDHTLQATALVNEAYLRLLGEQGASWEDRIHFLRVAARAMRSVLIDHARSRDAAKRGDGWRRSPLEEAAVFTDQPSSDLLALDEALTRLSDLDDRLAQVVELRFFGGLTIEETARVLKISTATVKREWLTAKAWLREEIRKGEGRGR